MAKKVIGEIKLQIPAGQANPSPPVGPALGSARRQHYGVLQVIQCRDSGAAGDDHAGHYHRLCRPFLYFRHQNSAGVGLAEKSRWTGKRFCRSRARPKSAR